MTLFQKLYYLAAFGPATVMVLLMIREAINGIGKMFY
jgi:hypothetical protein